jgi:hypothetical protein
VTIKFLPYSTLFHLDLLDEDLQAIEDFDEYDYPMGDKRNLTLSIFEQYEGVFFVDTYGGLSIKIEAEHDSKELRQNLSQNLSAFINLSKHHASRMERWGEIEPLLHSSFRRLIPQQDGVVVLLEGGTALWCFQQPFRDSRLAHLNLHSSHVFAAHIPSNVLGEYHWVDLDLISSVSGYSLERLRKLSWSTLFSERVEVLDAIRKVYSSVAISCDQKTMRKTEVAERLNTKVAA